VLYSGIKLYPGTRIAGNKTGTRGQGRGVEVEGKEGGEMKEEGKGR